MSTISSYFKNATHCNKMKRNKRRLSNEGANEHNSKKRALSVDSDKVDFSKSLKETNGECSTSGEVGNNKVKEIDNNAPSNKLDECINEETFINNVEEFQKSTQDFSYISKLCLTKEFSQLQPSTTHAISNLASQPYIGLIEQDKLKSLVEFLLQLYQYEDTFSEFQEKSRIWAITQLKKTLCLPTSVLYEKEYLHPLKLQTAVTKIVSVMASEKCRKQKISNEIIRILCLMGVVVLKMPVLPSSSFTQSLLQILFENKPSLSIMQELLEHLNTIVTEDKIDINPESLGHLWSLHPSSLEAIVVDMLIESKIQNGRRMTKSKLVQACCCNSLLFQKIINMFVAAWLQTAGDASVASKLSAFVCLVQTACVSSSLLSLFPDNLWPLVLLLQIPVTDLLPAMQKLHAYSISSTFSETLLNGLCQMRDVIILFLIFPSWYQVLHNLCINEPSSDIGMLKMLVNAD